MSREFEFLVPCLAGGGTGFLIVGLALKVLALFV